MEQSAASEGQELVHPGLRLVRTGWAPASDAVKQITAITILFLMMLTKAMLLSGSLSIANFSVL